MDARSMTDGNAAVIGMELLRVRRDGIVAAAALEVQPLEASLRNLGRQAALAAPAKLALSRARAPVILAEAPAWAEGDRIVATIRMSLAMGLQWLNRNEASAEPVDVVPGKETQDPGESCIRWIDEALGAIACTWERVDPWAYRVRTASAATAARIEPIAGVTAVRVRHDARPLRAPTPDVERALGLFALEANARFRFARLSVGRPERSHDGPARDVVSATWDAVVLPGPAGVRWLAEALDALEAADAETRRGLRALTNAAVAEAYLVARDPRRRGRGVAAV